MLPQTMFLMPLWHVFMHVEYLVRRSSQLLISKIEDLCRVISTMYIYEDAFEPFDLYLTVCTCLCQAFDIMITTM